MEEWKTVYGFEDYEISSCGRVKTKSRPLRYVHAKTQNEHYRTSKERFLKIYINDLTGYKFVQLYSEGKSYNKTIHRLVAANFIENTDFYRVVNHKNGNKHDNTVINLEWCTDAYNHQHATETGLKAKGSQIGTSVLNDACVTAIKKLLSMDFTHVQIAELFEVSRTTIPLIAEEKTWKHVTKN